MADPLEYLAARARIFISCRTDPALRDQSRQEIRPVSTDRLIVAHVAHESA